MIEPAAATNRLAGEKSPYLLQHARNPVDWRPWGEAAFAEARATGRPIFLSIGYSTCHWCHVMAYESFEDPRVAAVMNELFVNIKVDREERPDVDRVYMTFVQATTGSGGWPMSVWLQPDLKPIFGGTYFPPADRYGQRGFVAVCRAIADVWKNDRAKINAQSEQVVAYLREHTAAEASPAGGLPEADALLAGAGRALAAAFDAQWGGFGQAPKFPRPALLHLLARVQARRPAEPAAREMMLTTLDKMAAGGMHDAIGGGFHRYAVDRYWHVPHFEKMLYDQAQLTLAYLEAFQITGAATYAATARDILGYVSRDLTAPEGGFYCAEDADSLLAHGRPEHAEGAFYVWTKAEIEQALGAAGEAELFCAHYGIEASGNTPPGSDPHGEFTGKNIPIERQPLEETARQFSLDPAEGANRLAESRRKLFAVRETRPRPHLDDKIVTSWNGLMISAFARAAQVLGDASYLTNARHAADFLKQHLYRAADGILLRSFREEPASIEGFADDYAFLIQGLLDLYEAGFNIGDLEWAQRLQEKQDELFHDPELGGYFAASGRDPSVLLRMKEDHDGAEPSASSISTLNLGRLAAMTGRADWQARAVQTASAFVSGRPAERLAHALPMMLVAVDFLSREPKRIAIAGRADAPDTQAMLRAVHERFVPGKVLLLIDGAEGRQALAARLPYLATAVMLEGRATAYLCQDQACQLPTVEPDQLAAML